MRVLLCDDTVELRSLLRAALQGDDVAIVGEAGDGDGALRLARETRPDIVVLDLEMPGPTPHDLLTGLRAAAPAAAIVTFSGHDPVAVAGAAAAAEIALHVPKTTDLAVAAQAVRDVARGRRSD